MDNPVARRNTALLQSVWCEKKPRQSFSSEKSQEAEIQQAWTRETEVYIVTYEPSSHSGSTKLPPPLTPGSHDFLPLNLGLAVTFLVAMAVMREPPPLLIPNAATDGDNRRLLLLTAVPLTKKELLQTTTAEDTLLAIAISGIDNAVPCVFLFVATLYELRVRCNWGGAGVGRGSALRRYLHRYLLGTQDRLRR